MRRVNKSPEELRRKAEELSRKLRLLSRKTERNSEEVLTSAYALRERAANADPVGNARRLRKKIDREFPRAKGRKKKP